ncbi:unnamed protein product, partial [Mesorhabditis belari]|uniref:Uncharacterized protein n=1 Tax=Mesorhabditis belari TaxID=2138241 RepID=A0AAF3EQU7_9BILA
MTRNVGAPRIIKDGTHELHLYQSSKMGKELKFEAVVTYGMTSDEIMSIEQTIVNHLSGDQLQSGRETNQIGDELEKKFGGYWMVGIFEDPYGMAYTVSRRSPMYVVFEVNEKAGILCASQGSGGNRLDKFKITKDGFNTHLLQRPKNH